MIKRVFWVVTLFALVLGSVGLSTAPATAAPAAAVTPVAPNSNLMPPDTGVYFNFRAADLTSTIDFVRNTVEKVTGSRPSDPFVNVDQGLSQFLGRDVNFATDIQPWLGDNISFALRVTDKQLADLSKVSSGNSMSSVFSNPEFIAIISVKDDAKAAPFFKEVVDKLVNAKLTTRTVTLPGNTDKVTVYDQGGCTAGETCGSLYEANGYIAVGTTGTINTELAMLTTGSASLNSNPTFGRIIKSLKPTSLLTAYLTPRFYQLYAAILQSVMPDRRPVVSGASTPVPGPSATDLLKAAFASIQGQAFAARLDGKVLAFDIAQSVDMNAMTRLYQTLGYSAQTLQGLKAKPIQSKLAAQIPDKALATVIASNLPGLYNALQQSLQVATKMNTQMGVPSQRFNPDQIAAMFQIVQSAIKVVFDLDLNTEVFSWMNGEFALYLTYNPDSVLSKVSKNGPVPFDVTMLVESTDVAKTRSFLAKVNLALQKNAPLSVESAGTDLYTVTMKNGLSIGYGLVKNTFVMSTGSGLEAAVAALNGDGVLSNSTVWKNAQASMVNPTSSVWLLNFTQWGPLVQAMAASGGGRSNTQQVMALLDLLESASVSGGIMQPDGSSSISFQILLK